MLSLNQASQFIDIVLHWFGLLVTAAFNIQTQQRFGIGGPHIKTPGTKIQTYAIGLVNGRVLIGIVLKIF